MVFVICEIGNNHQGDLGLAEEMIEVAIDAGCNAVKFQTYVTEKLIGLDRGTLRYLHKAELDLEGHYRLLDCCGNRIDFLSSPFDLDSINLLHKLNLTTAKVPSGKTDKEYLGLIKCSFPQVILSTGMCNLQEVQDSVDILSGCEIAILHCNSAYPSPYEDMNLRAMETLRQYFHQVPIGLSDHTIGIEVPIAACALGAELLEKHFTLDRNMDGPDQRMSIEPSQLRQMVKGIRNIELAMGNGIKKPTPSEEKTMKRRQK